MFFKKEDKIKREISELRQEIDNLKSIVKSSTGNKGVQTDIRQTSSRQYPAINPNLLATTTPNNKDLTTTKEDISAIDVVNLVNDFKESLIRKFKSITDQEFFIFSLIYSLEEQLGAVSYKNLSEKAGISESAIRDHVRGLIQKGIPLIKEKANNRTNFFKISHELRSVVSLDSLMYLRVPYKNLGVPLNNLKSQEILNILD